MVRTMALRIALSVLVLAAWSSARATVRVEVRGARAVPASTLQRIVSAATDSTSLRSALERAQSEYLRRGYMRARIDARAGGQGTDSLWVVTVSEGRRATIATASVAGVLSRPREEVVAALGIRPGSVYEPKRIAARIRSLLSDYDERGLPFAQVWVDSVGYDPGADAVGIKLFVVEGGERVIRSVEVEGLAKTRPEFARRIAGIDPGRPYRASLLRSAYARLSASGIFTEVEFPVVRIASDGQGVDVALVVEEPQRSHTFTSALGYAEAEGEEDRQISGLVDLRLNNIGGTLRNVAVLWSNDGRDRVETRLDYRDQFFLGRNLALGVRLHQVGLDTVYTWQSLGMEVERPVGALSLSFGLHGDRNVFSVGDLRRSWRVRASAGVGVHRGGTRGSSLAVLARATVARKRRIAREGPDETLSQYIAEVETDAVLSLRPILHLRNALVYRGLESDEDVVPLSERFYIGGARTLRGYKENQFNGRRVATARTELLLGRSRNENVYLFADVGYALRETPTPEGRVDREELVKTGYGFGLRTRSRVGNVELSFGVGEKLSLKQTKVHVLLEQSF
jgi:outer membrane protein assembly factor BamA